MTDIDSLEVEQCTEGCKILQILVNAVSRFCYSRKCSYCATYSIYCRNNSNSRVKLDFITITFKD